MKITFKQTVLFAAASLALVSCKDDKNETAQTEPEKTPGINTTYMDTTTTPNNNFFEYVNGNWLKETTIPDDRTSWGSFQELRKNTDNNVLSIMTKAQNDDDLDADSDQAKAVYVYNSKLDTVARNKAGLKPFESTLTKIEGIQNINDLQTVVAENPTSVANPFFGLTAFANPTNSSMNSAYIAPGSLGLDRDYYLKDDSDSKEVRKEYVAHITRMLQFLGDSKESAKDQAETILKMETTLAKPRFTKVESRDFRNYNNPRSLAQVQEMVPAINWKKWIKDLGVEKELDTVLVMQPKYMKSIQKVFAKGDVKDWKTLIRWASFNEAAGELNTEIDKANWDFYSKTLHGTKQQRPAKERALATVNNTVGEAVGKLYVKEFFPPEAKEQAEEMIENIIAAYKIRINKLEWMTDETKEKAIQKLDSFTIKVGYPDKWEDYSEMKVNKDNTYYENMMAAGDWSYRDNLSKIGEPVDKTKWGMSPQTVNAYYNPSVNEIVFPAAILQPPFYNYKADAAVNFGGVGAVIGHEISHAFDDSGARFDSQGNLHNWWTDEDLEKFTKRADKLADLYSNVEVMDSLYINGKFTLGENIGDLGGVLASYDGLEMYLKKHGRPGKINGFTPEQRFFMSWATVWRTKMRKEALRSQVKTNPHSPGKYRAYIPLQNVDAFYKAFDIKEGDSMYVAPKDRVSIW